MATEVHSKRCSPSKLELEFLCELSSEFYATQEKDEAGAEAIYGNQTHLIAETMTANGLQVKGFDEPIKSVEEVVKECSLYDDEMFKLATLFSSSCIRDIEYEKKRTGETPFILIENTLDMSYLLPNENDEMIGTLDFGFISKDTLVIKDLKTGRVIKSAGKRKEDGTLEINPQLGAYCSAVLHHYGYLYPITNIHLVIHQERMNSVSEIELTIEEFEEWERTVLIPKIQRLYQKDLKATPNPLCKYCPGKGNCKARTDANMKVHESKKEPAFMTDDEIEDLLPKLDELVKYAEDVKAYAIKRMEDGHKFKRHKLVYSRVTRTFSDSDAVAKILIDNGYEAYSKPKLLGITDVQKQLGKAKMNELLGEYITTNNGSVTIAPIDDAREEILINKEK